MAIFYCSSVLYYLFLYNSLLFIDSFIIYFCHKAKSAVYSSWAGWCCTIKETNKTYNKKTKHHSAHMWINFWITFFTQKWNLCYRGHCWWLHLSITLVQTEVSISMNFSTNIHVNSMTCDPLTDWVSSDDLLCNSHKTDRTDRKNLTNPDTVGVH